MRMLIVGIGALGGTIAARAILAGHSVRLAARNADSILLATKAQDALEVASCVVGLLAPEGVMLPIQNGAVARDFERGRKAEIDFINGYVVTLGRASGVPVDMNTRITGLVRRIERVALRPAPDRMNDLHRGNADASQEVTRK